MRSLYYWFASATVVVLSQGWSARAETPPPTVPNASANTKYETVALRGRIVWQAEAMQRRFGVETDPDAAKAVIALETRDGAIVPLVKDFRGRGFHLDPKLQEFDWELLVRRYPGAGAVQVVRTYVWRGGKKYEFDYWCDICAIPMYELKECECCQGPIRFRLREVGE